MDILRIKEIMDRCINSHEETGASFVVTQNGEQTLTYSCGMADKENQKAFDENTICKAFSCSKVATSACVMMLIERGLIDINWELQWFIPEFSNPVYIREGTEYKSRNIKIRDLLNMTSGIAYPGDWHEGVEKINTLWWELDESIKAGKSLSTVEFAKRAGKCPLSFEAGHEWMYGSSADILGALVEIISKQRFSEFMKENLLDPLGMNDTAFYCPKEKADRLAVLYENNGESPKILEGANLCIYNVSEPPAFESGGAGLFTTAKDYAKLGAMLSNGGVYNGKQIIGRKTIEFMATNGLTPEQKTTFNWDATKGYGYANLVRMLDDSNASGSFASKGAFGWDGWTGTYLLCDPAEKISVTLFVQRCGAGTTQLSRHLVNAVYSQI